MHTAAVGVDGLVWTWGCNDDGALGRTGDEDVPQLVTGGALAAARVSAVTCGDSVSGDGRQGGGLAVTLALSPTKTLPMTASRIP